MLPRRHFVKASAISAAVLASQSLCQADTPDTAQQSDSVSSADNKTEFRYCLNTSTINGSKVPIREQLRIASQAGYDAVELWLRDIQKYTEEGGKIADLNREISDLGLGVDSAIAFGNWIVDDDQKRIAGLEQSRRDMEIIRALGGRRIAAPPSGATNLPKLDLNAAADRYKTLLELGRSCEVIPQLELWGFSANLSTLAEILYIAAAANDADACILLDIYHLYKGGSDFNNMKLVPATQMFCLHMNDYPALPARAEIGDKDRVFPGDGVAPLSEILRELVAGGFRGTLSLELFNQEYHKQPASLIAKTGLEKMKAVVASL